MNRRPCMAVASIRGGAENPCIRGTVEFRQMCDGTLVDVQIEGLPESPTGFFAFHIHEGSDCRGAGFSDTGGHFNPENREHPCHAGDLPPLLSNCGVARMTVLTGRFRVLEVIGRTVVIHIHPDDFHTQPSGNAGEKIACGVIRKK